MAWRWWNRHADDADQGVATAEFAVVLPCVAAVAIAVLCVGRASITSMNCQDAAAAGARAVTIEADGGDAAARTAALAVAGDGASVALDMEADAVTVTVRCPVIPDSAGVLPTWVVGKAVRYF